MTAPDLTDEQCDEIAREAEGLRADAERYRWLRDPSKRLCGVGSWEGVNRTYWRHWGDDAELDATIDAARALTAQGEKE